jgi:hypothetical protein
LRKFGANFFERPASLKSYYLTPLSTEYLAAFFRSVMEHRKTERLTCAGAHSPGVFSRSFAIRFRSGRCRGTITAQGGSEPTAPIVVAPDGSEILFNNSIKAVVIHIDFGNGSKLPSPNRK